MEIRRTAIWLTAGMVASILPTSASTTTVRQGVSLDIDVSTPVSLREPVVLKYVVLNESVRPVVADLGYDRAGAFELELKGPDGGRQIARPRLRFVDGGSSARSATVTIAPGGRYEQRIVLDEWLRFDNAGAHVLQVRFFGVLAFSSGSADDAARTTAVDGGLQPPSATVTSPDRTFHVLILPRDERRLEESLRAIQARLSRLDSSEVSDAVNELVHIRDPLAVPYLENAMASRVSPRFAAALARIGTQEARLALERLTAHPTLWVAESARTALATLK